MLTVMVISSLLSITFATLFIRYRYRFRQMLQQQQADQAGLQEEIARLKDKLLAESRDPVTQLLGWTLFEDRVNQSIKESQRYQFIMGVLCVDIDSFDLLNQAMGVAMGEQLLQETALRLQSCIRQVDSISHQGKGSFVIMLPQLAKQETAAIIIQRILQTMTESFAFGDQKTSVTVCVGAAFYPNDGASTNELIQNAQYALQQAQSRGKHLYQFYQQNLHAKSQRELVFYNSMTGEGFLNELKLMYQPVMEMQDHMMHCVDTQIVWHHRELGAVSSDELFQYADKHRKLNKITERVLHAACKQFLHWRSLGVKPQLLCIPVLLKQLENAQFVYRISQILQDLKMQPAWLMLEIKESAAPVSLDILEKSFNMLQYLGVRIGIDHFGSGSFSLRYLKALSVSYLKLDAALISDVGQREQTQALVKAVVAFAEELSLTIIAVGVESEEQAAVLAGLGIDLMQGQLVSQPLSDAEMTAKMSDM